MSRGVRRFKRLVGAILVGPPPSPVHERVMGACPTPHPWQQCPPGGPPLFLRKKGRAALFGSPAQWVESGWQEVPTLASPCSGSRPLNGASDCGPACSDHWTGRARERRYEKTALFRCFACAHAVWRGSRCVPSPRWIMIDSRAGAFNVGGFYERFEVRAREGWAGSLDAKGCLPPPSFLFTGTGPAGPWNRYVRARASPSSVQLRGSGSFTWLSKQARRAFGRAASSSPIDDAYALAIACCP